GLMPRYGRVLVTTTILTRASAPASISGSARYQICEIGVPMTVSEPIGGVERLVSAHAAKPHRSRRRASPMDRGFMGSALLAGPANEIKQLARPGVRYGVVARRVE